MPLRIDIAPAIHTVRDYADDAIRTLRDRHGLRLDHSLDSLAHVDAVLSAWREGGAPLDTVTRSLYAFGSYAGEVLREREPGRWVQPPKRDHGAWDEGFLFVRLLDGREWRPISVAFAVLMGEAPYSLQASARELLATPVHA